MPDDKEARIVRGKDGQLRLENFYTPLLEAEKEIRRRWNDKELKKKVEKFLGGDVPEVFSDNPKAVLFRYIATPDFEYIRALKLARVLGLKLVYLEFLNDKFCTINLDKRTLGRMHFFRGKNHKGDCIVSKKNVFDLATNDGKPFKKIKTFSGENLVDFHYHLFEPYFKETETYDISKFAKKNGKNAKATYPFFLALFTCFGILFEAYDVAKSKEERKFFREVVGPAFEKIKKEIGVKPLIVRLYENGDENNIFWCCYPEFLKKALKTK